jgi:hypothetical protein
MSEVLAALTIAPLVLGLFLAIGAWSLSEKHAPFKIALFLLSISTFYMSMYVGTVAFQIVYTSSELVVAISKAMFWATMIYIITISYFVMYFIYVLIEKIRTWKQKRLEY